MVEKPCGSPSAPVTGSSPRPGRRPSGGRGRAGPPRPQGSRHELGGQRGQDDRDVRFWSVTGFSSQDFGAAVTGCLCLAVAPAQAAHRGRHGIDGGAHFADMMLHCSAGRGGVRLHAGLPAAQHRPPELGRGARREDTWLSTWKFANGILGQFSWSSVRRGVRRHADLLRHGRQRAGPRRLDAHLPEWWGPDPGRRHQEAVRGDRAPVPRPARSGSAPTLFPCGWRTTCAGMLGFRRRRAPAPPPGDQRRDTRRVKAVCWPSTSRPRWRARKGSGRDRRQGERLPGPINEHWGI